MTSVREFRHEDVAQVVALHGRVFGTNGTATPQRMAGYFEDVLFRNPWHDPSLPSLVSVNDGDVTGFLGVVPRPMTLHGKRVRVAVCTQFMVDPRHRIDLGAVRLLKAFFSGPQELSFADGANDEARRMWIALGGNVPLLYSLHWFRPLRPARYALSLVERRARKSRPLTLMARPLAALADAALARILANGSKDTESLVEEPLHSSTMIAHLPEVMDGTALRPAYDERSLRWLLEQAARKTRHGKLRARAVLDREHKPIGWYLYYVQAGAVSEVIQIAARHGYYGVVLKRLVADARSQRATAVRGRLDPRFVQQLSDHHCWFRRENSWTLIHSRYPDIAAAVLQGEAFLTRLEGEWWLRFQGG